MASRLQPREGVIDRTRFNQLVEKAMSELPPEFVELLGGGNVAPVVKDYPSEEQLHSVGLERPLDLLGLYEGIPLTERSVFHTGGEPDRIYIFRMPIEAICQSDEEVEEQVRQTVVHEVGHFFGISDERLDELMEEEHP